MKAWLKENPAMAALMGLIAALSVAAVGIVVLALQEQGDFRDYVQENDCRVVHSTAPRYTTFVGPNGQMTQGVAPRTNTWQCANGRTFTR